MKAVIERFEEAAAGPGPIRLGSDAGALPPDELVEAVKRLPLQSIPRALTLSEALLRIEDAEAWRRARFLAARAHVLCYANRFEEAMAALAEARTFAEVAPSPAEPAWIELASVQPLARLGRMAEAERAAAGAAAIFASAGERIGQGKALLNLGIVQRMRGRPAESVATFEGAIGLVVGDPFLSAAIASNRAEALQDLDRFAEAERSFEDALAGFVASSHEHAAAIVEGNIADLMSRQGKLDLALERYERVRARFEAAGAEADVARLLAEESDVLGTIGAERAALTAYAGSIPALERAGLAQELARARLGLGLILLRAGRTADARRTLAAALESLENTDNLVLAAQCRIVLASLAVRAGRLREVPADAAAALEALADRPAQRTHAVAELVDARLDAGDLDLGSEVEKLERRADELSLGPLRARVAHLRGRWLGASGRAAEATVAFARAVRDADALRGSLRAEPLRIAFSHSRASVFHDAFAAGLEEGGPRGLALAFEAVERLRARSLLEAMGSRAAQGAAQGPGSEAIRRLDAIERDINVLYSSLAVASVRRQPTAAAIDSNRLSRLEAEAATLRERVARNDDVNAVFASPLSLDEACQAVPEGAAVVMFGVEGEALSALVLRAGTVRAVRRFAARGQIATARERADFALADLFGADASRARDPLWRRSLARLGELILDPLAAHLDGTDRVWVCPSTELHGLPWGLLPLGGSPAMERLAIGVTPGVSVGIRLARAGGAPGGGSLAVGFSDEIAPGMEREAAEVALALPGTTLLAGELATSGRVLDAMPRAAVVHIAAHCIFSPWHPMSSRVRLADRWATARELAGAVRPGASIVLAGCETGASAGDAGEDRQGFVHGLLSAGAREVIASMWPLHDRTAVRVVTDMFRRSANRPGSSPTPTKGLSIALRDAQLGALRSGVPPQWWGGLVSTGGVG